MDIGKLKQDADFMDEGDWVGDIPGMGDLRLKVRASQSRIVRRAMTRKGSDYSDQADAKGRLPDELAERLTGEVCHEVVLLDWDGLEKDGEPFPYDKETAREWCTNPDFESFVVAVNFASAKVSDRSRGREEVLSKNSVKPSSGSSTGAAKSKR